MSSDPQTNPSLDEAAVDRLFSERGLRCTKQRRGLYVALASTDRHPTAEELYERAQPHTPGLSLATVYNTLEAFCRAGLAQRLPNPGGPSRYDAAMHNHLHVRDLQSGQVVDAPEDLSEQMLEHLPQELVSDIESRLGFRLKQVEIQLVGEFE